MAWLGPAVANLQGALWTKSCLEILSCWSDRTYSQWNWHTARWSFRECIILGPITSNVFSRYCWQIWFHIFQYLSWECCFHGRLSQILQAADMYYARIRKIELQVNPQESVIFIRNIDSTYSAPLARNIPRGMQIPCTSDGLKILDVPIGIIQYVQSLCKNIISRDVIWLSSDNFLICTND